MNQAYQDAENAQKYLNFLNSENGKIQQDILHSAIIKQLSANKTQAILDAACGPGWLTKKLSLVYENVQGCDSSEIFINFANKNYRGIKFNLADVEFNLPYDDNFFDCIILNMAAPDLENLADGFHNFFKKIKPSGQLILTVPNPYYTYPAAEWKKGLWGFLTGQKPKLKIKTSYFTKKNIAREFNRGETIFSYFYGLDNYINSARTAGFTLVHMEEIKSGYKSPNFNLRYQLYRYPLILLLEFAKPGFIS